jgi:uncharacterized protein (DUF302 family)
MLLQSLRRLAAAFLLALAHGAAAGDNPALWKHSVGGDYAKVLAGIRHGLAAAQFQILGEDNLSRGLENNMEIFGADRWNTIGFGRVTTLHFCSLAFNQQVFNMDMDWSVLCPFKVSVYNMRSDPQRIHLVLVRPTWILGQDPHPRAREIGQAIEARIVEALREGTGL